jgi:hypothetical protein
MAQRKKVVPHCPTSTQNRLGKKIKPKVILNAVGLKKCCPLILILFEKIVRRLAKKIPQ